MNCDHCKKEIKTPVNNEYYCLIPKETPYDLSVAVYDVMCLWFLDKPHNFCKLSCVRDFIDELLKRNK